MKGSHDMERWIECTVLRPEPSAEVKESHATTAHPRESTQDPTGQYTDEQLLIRERGLRILARMVVRAYLRNQNASANYPDTDTISTHGERTSI